MRSYKMWILLILLSVVSFSEEIEDPKNNSIGVWVSSIGVDRDDPDTDILELTLKSRTGEKFEEMDRLILNAFQLVNGLNEVSYDSVSSTKVEGSDTIEKPKIITEWYVGIDLGFKLGAEPITLNGTVLVEDLVDGNQHAIDGKKLSFGPFEIAPNDKTELRIYEKLSDLENWVNSTTSPESEDITDKIPENGITVIDDSGKVCIFTKGGPGSFEENPGVYALVSTDGGAKIEKLKVKKNGGTEETLIVPYLGGSESVIMKIGGFESDKINTITIRPVSIYGIEGDEVELDFLIDTQINTVYLEGGIIGELKKDVDGEKKIFVELSELKELSGVARYNYVFTVVEKTATDGEVSVSGESSFQPSKDSNLGTVKIPISDFIDGSKGTLLFTVYDKLGHEKTFEKTYFIPEQSEIKATVKGEAKQRRSKIKLISEGNNDKFGVDNSVDTSSE